MTVYIMSIIIFSARRKTLGWKLRCVFFGDSRKPAFTRVFEGPNQEAVDRVALNTVRTGNRFGAHGIARVRSCKTALTRTTNGCF